MPRAYPVPPHVKETWGQLQEIIKFGYPASQVFSDFLDTVLNTLLSFTYNFAECSFEELQDRLRNDQMQGPYEDRYRTIVRKYKENATKPQGQRPADFIASAWGALQVETEASESDVLGAIYETQITLGEQGQFFTPEAITRMVVEMLGAEEGEKIVEPAVGSGRFLIGAGKLNPHRTFVGIDKNLDCARMCAINMHLFNLNANIYWGNSLSMEMWTLWRTRRPFGWVWEHDVTSGEAQSQEPEEKPVEIKTEEHHAAPASIEIVRGVRRIDGYKSSEGDPLFDVAFVFEREDLDDRIDQFFTPYPYQRTTIGDFPAIATSANVAPMIEEIIKNFLKTSKSSAEEQTTAEQPAPQDLKQKRHTTNSAKRRKKKHTTSREAKPVQQSLFDMED